MYHGLWWPWPRYLCHEAVFASFRKTGGLGVYRGWVGDWGECIGKLGRQLWAWRVSRSVGMHCSETGLGQECIGGGLGARNSVSWHLVPFGLGLGPRDIVCRPQAGRWVRSVSGVGQGVGRVYRAVWLARGSKGSRPRCECSVPREVRVRSVSGAC